MYIVSDKSKISLWSLMPCNNLKVAPSLKRLGTTAIYIYIHIIYIYIYTFSTSPHSCHRTEHHHLTTLSRKRYCKHTACHSTTKDDGDKRGCFSGMEKWMRQAYEVKDKGMSIPEKLTPSRPKELLISSDSNKELHLASAEQIEPAKQRKGRSPKNTENRSAEEVEEFNDNRSMTELLSGNSTKTLSRLKEILDMVAEDLNREAIEKSEKQPLEHTKRQKPFQYTTTAATLLPGYSAASGDLHLGGMFVNESLSIVNEAKRSSSDAEQTSELGLNSPSQGEADDL